METCSHALLFLSDCYGMTQYCVCVLETLVSWDKGGPFDLLFFALHLSAVSGPGSQTRNVLLTVRSWKFVPALTAILLGV